MNSKSADLGEERTGRFLDSFCRLEKYLREYTQSDKGVGVNVLVERASKSNSAVRAKKDDLKGLADLRNAIVYERRDGEPIAIPNEIAVSLIESVEAYITKPPKVIPTFKCDVFVCSPEDPIAIAVEAMYKYKYSQILIVQNVSFMKLLTAITKANC